MGYWLLFRGNELLVTEGAAGFAVPLGADLQRLGLNSLNQHAVGTFGDTPCYTGNLPAGAEPPPGMTFAGLRTVYGKVPGDLFRLAGRAFQILEWDRTHRFCGTCGSPTELRTDEYARACPACGTLAYPRLTPAVIVLIRDGDRALLARSHRFPPGRYSTVAGFVEPGESLEEAVAREVLEEVGVTLRNVRYFGSQPWPFPHSLMIGFTADYAGGAIRLQEAEIEDAQWFHVNSLPELPPPLSIARQLIDWFVAECGR